MTNQEYQLQKLRAILLNEKLPSAERVVAQRQIMKILDLKEEETDGECTAEKITIINQKGGIS